MRQIFTRRGKFFTLFAVLMLAAGIVWAVNPHFIFVKSSLQEDGDLDVAFKEAGLGDNLNINYLAEADVTTICQCVNNSGNCPQASNKVTSTSHEAQPATFNSGKNGQINQTITLHAPPCPPSDPPTCGNGQVLKLASITWNNIQLTDQTTPVGPVAAEPASLSGTFFTCPQ